MSYWSSITKTLLVFQQLNINNHHVHLDEVGDVGGGLTVLHWHSPITLLRYLEIVAAGLLRRLFSNNWGSGVSSVESTSITVTSSNSWGSSITVTGSSNWGSSISTNSSNSWSSSNSWGSMDSSNWDLANSVDWGVDSLADGLDGVGSGLVNNWLADGLVSSDWSVDGLGSVGGDALEDWLGNMGSLDNGSWLVGGNWGGDVGVGGLSNWVGQGGDLGGDLSEGMGLSSGVSKVSSKSVVLNAGTVMSWGSDKVWGSSQRSSIDSCNSWSNSHGGGSAESNEGREEQEGVHVGCC